MIVSRDAEQRERMVKSELSLMGNGIVHPEAQFMNQSSSRNEAMATFPKYRTKDDHRSSLTDFLGFRSKSPLSTINNDHYNMTTFGPKEHR